MDTIPQSGRKRQLSTEPIFYTYLLCRSDAPFYVGKGKGRRIENHFTCARNHANCKHHVCRIIRKERRMGREVTKVKVIEDIPEQDAFAFEQFFIALGTILDWPLVNKTAGGEGTSGFRRTMSPEEKERNRLRSIKRFSNPEEIEKMRRGATRRWASPEEREKQSQMALRRFSDPNERAQHRQRMQEIAGTREQSAEERERRRQGAIRQWLDLERREKRSQQAIQRHENLDEAERERLSQAGKAMWEDPEYREKVMQKRNDPAVKAKMSKARSEGNPNHIGTFEGFVDPQGQIFAPVINLTAFCRERSLSYCGMWLVAQGKQSSHKGWKRYDPTGAVVSVQPKKERKSIQGNTFHAKVHVGFVSPDGTVYTDIYNLKAFCREHGLSASKMCLVDNGKSHAHKGWTRYNPETSQPSLFEP